VEKNDRLISEIEDELDRAEAERASAALQGFQMVNG
jgi:hypothetical protein